MVSSDVASVAGLDQDHHPMSLSPTEIRRHIVKMIAKAEGPHLPSNLSAVEIIYTLYARVLRIDPADPKWPDRDRVLIKGTAAAALHATLVARGLLDAEVLDTYKIDGSKAFGLVDHHGFPWVEASTSSLGRSLSIGTGMAIAAQQDGRPTRVFVVVGDGECQEGAMWEAAMFVPARRLSNLTLIIDDNSLQGCSMTRDLMGDVDLRPRFASFGWDATEVDGHDINALEQALIRPSTRPKAIVAKTIKGKGVSMMENAVDWHYRRLTQVELLHALRDLR